MNVPGPAALGRGVVVTAGQEVPAPWAGSPEVVVDEAALSDPADVVQRLHEAWATRSPVVVVLAVDPARFRAPVDYAGEPWTFGAEHEVWFDRLHFLVWANTYDARSGEPVWWWARKAVGAGATEHAGGAGDVVLDGAPAWVDGGPRAPQPGDVEGAGVVHCETVELGGMALQRALASPDGDGRGGAHRGPDTDLAPDQLAAVSHGAGPARVIAPAGSGKTRVLTERLRELLGRRGYEVDGVLAVAYNKKAQEEMAARTPGLGARVQTLNAWAYSLVARWLGRRPDVLDERDVRRIVEGLVPRSRRRVNTDPIRPYLDGLSLIRLGLRDPAEVEASTDDVDGLAEAFPRFRAELRRQGVVDFDEQVYLAVEGLLADGGFRRSVQREHRHLLIDELQDLTPAHVLLARLVAAPGFDVFGVGDDDQTIYGHAGADPRFLIRFADYFPGAQAHALEVNYRCPQAVTTAAATLLGYNRRRVDKQIRPGPDVDAVPDALAVRVHAATDGATALVGTVGSWLDEPGAEPASVAVLARVGSLLLAPHVALAAAGVPIDSILTEDVLGRLGVRASLAYVRIATAPDRIVPADLVEVHRRPSRGLPNWAEKWLGRCRSVDDVRRAAERIDDDKVSDKLGALSADLDHLVGLARNGATSRDLLLAVRDDIGLGSAMTLLDSTGGAGGSHLDDLEALLQVADLHPDAGSFEPWLRAAFGRQRAEGGVTLSTVHRVKGREWDRVVVFGVTEGLVPHRLADDVEEERRVLHVAITRGRRRVVVLGDAGRPSPFLAELDGSAPTGRVIGTGGRPGAVVGARARPAPASTGGVALSPEAAATAASLRAWRRERSSRDRVPAYVVLSDKHLEAIAARAPGSLVELRACPGIGPARLDQYGDEILAVVAASGPS